MESEQHFHSAVPQNGPGSRVNMLFYQSVANQDTLQNFHHFSNDRLRMISGVAAENLAMDR